MTRKEIKQLVIVSYTKEKLDMKKINRIVKLFTKKDFTSYIKYLKAYEKTKTVIIETPNLNSKNELLKQMKEVYSNKNIEIKENKSLLAGIKIIDNDMVYEQNLKNKLENIVSFINY